MEVAVVGIAKRAFIPNRAFIGSMFRLASTVWNSSRTASPQSNKKTENNATLTRLIVKLATLASTCWLSIGAANAETRLALVIGNSSYTSVSSLPNPANDARAMANFLSSAGFRVTEAPNQIGRAHV